MTGPSYNFENPGHGNDWITLRLVGVKLNRSAIGARIKNIEVWWPTSGTRQNFTGILPNQFLEIKEFDAHPHKLDRHAFRLGGPARRASAAIVK